MPDTMPFSIRGNNFNMVVLQLRDGAPEIVLPAVERLLQQSPAFLNGSPIVLGLDGLDTDGYDLDLSGLVEGLRRLKLVPVGIAGGTASQRQDAAAAGLAQLTKGQQTFKAKNGAEAPKQASEPTPKTEFKPAEPASNDESVSKSALPAQLVTQPVRAGSRIYAQGCDLICTAAVNAGAEIIADGHIHVYGALRGRAIAGASGFDGARIFALNFDPELVAIAGLYRVREHLDQALAGSGVQVSLHGDEMRMATLA